MQIYTIKEASRKTKIGVETLKRALEEGLIKATRLANRQWRIAESALEEALHEGIDLRGLFNPRDAQRGKLKQSEKKQSESRCCMVKKPREASAIGVH